MSSSATLLVPDTPRQGIATTFHSATSIETHCVQMSIYVASTVSDEIEFLKVRHGSHSVAAEVVYNIFPISFSHTNSQKQAM